MLACMTHKTMFNVAYNLYKKVTLKKLIEQKKENRTDKRLFIFLPLHDRFVENVLSQDECVIVKLPASFTVKY